MYVFIRVGKYVYAYAYIYTYTDAYIHAWPLTDHKYRPLHVYYA